MMAMKVVVVIFVLVAVASCQDMLGSYNVDRESITLSGYSSGGTMAQIMQFSYSSLIRGIAVFSHTYYRCGPDNGDVDDYDKYCTSLGNLTDSEMYNASKVHDDIRTYLQMGLIEDTSNLKDSKLYVYTGLNSSLFTPRQALKILQVYEPYIQNQRTIKVRVQDATQLLPSYYYGAPCNQSAEETNYIGNCGFSGVTEAINFILFDDNDSADAFEKPSIRIRGNVSTFDQTEFTKDLKNHNMDDVGYYYIPAQCQANMSSVCYVHFYFHGCLTGRQYNGTQHVENSDLLELAERKNIIMIFPQALNSSANPDGCWDTFGVSGKYYATQQGAQVIAVKRMLDRVLEGADMGSTTTTTTTTVTPDVPEQMTSMSPSPMSPEEAQLALAQLLGVQKVRESISTPKLTYLPPPLPALKAVSSPLRKSLYRSLKRV